MSRAFDPDIPGADLSDESPAALPYRPQPWPLVVAVVALGLLLVGLSFRMAALGASAQIYYVVFWLGMAPAAFLVAERACAPAVARVDRVVAISLYGLLIGFPKFLRNPFGPSYHDEYAHFRQVTDVLATEQLFGPNTLIPIVELFPGTSALTAGVHLSTNLGVWIAGVGLIHVLHFAGFLGIFVLVESITRSTRAGAIAAIVYGLNPSAMYFSTQYAYESISINFFIWIVALGVLATRTEQTRRRAGLIAAALVLAAGMIATHHLSTLFLVLLLSGLVVVAWVWPWVTRVPGREFRIVLTSLWLGVVALSVAWVGLVARPALTYLSPYFGGSVDQLGAIASEDREAGRTLLAASVQPVWERALVAVVPALLALFSILVFVAFLRRWRRWRSIEIGLLAFAALYFPSVLFLIAPSGAEGARRSWGFLYIGIALLVAIIALREPRRPLIHGARRSVVAGGVFLIMLVGNVAAGLNDPYRFPGPFRWGTDTNSASLETRDAGRILFDLAGPQRIVTDSYSKLQLGGLAGHDVAMPSLGFPAWELFVTDSDPEPDLARQLSESNFRYVVVDLRMSEEDPFNMHNFGEHDPLAPYRVPREYLDRLDHVSWASRIIAGEHVRVYRIELAEVGAPFVTGLEAVK